MRINVIGLWLVTDNTFIFLKFITILVKVYFHWYIQAYVYVILYAYYISII